MNFVFLQLNNCKTHQKAVQQFPVVVFFKSQKKIVLDSFWNDIWLL